MNSAEALMPVPIATPQKPEAPALAQVAQMGSAVASQVNQVAGQLGSQVHQVAGQLGLSARFPTMSSPSVAASSTPDEVRMKHVYAPVVEQLFQWIQKTPGALAVQLDPVLSLPNSSYRVPQLSLNEQVEWLNEWFGMQGGQEETSWISLVLFALTSVSEGKLTSAQLLAAAERIVSRVARGAAGNQLTHYISEETGVAEEQIKACSDLYQQLCARPLFLPIRQPESIAPLPALWQEKLKLFQSVPGCSALLVEALSPAQRELYKIQLQTQDAELVEFNYTLLQGMSATEKRLWLQVNAHRAEGLLVCEQRELLQDAVVTQALADWGYQKIIIITSPTAAAAGSSTLMGEMASEMVDRATAVARDVLGTAQSVARTEPAARSLFPVSETCSLAPLTPAEQEQLLTTLLPEDGIQADLRSLLCAFCVLWVQEGQDMTLEKVRQLVHVDLERGVFKDCKTPKELCEAFTKEYMRGWEREFLYLANPRFTSLGYRIRRVVGRVFSTIVRPAVNAWEAVRTWRRFFQIIPFLMSPWGWVVGRFFRS
jgi:hypothetical protein